MRKKQKYNSSQLSLFDDFFKEEDEFKKTIIDGKRPEPRKIVSAQLEQNWNQIVSNFTQNTTENGNEISKNSRSERSDLYAQRERGNENVGNTAVEMSDNIQSNQRTSARAVSKDDAGQEPYSIFGEDWGRMVAGNSGISKSEDVDSGIGAKGLGQLSDKSWTALTQFQNILDFELNRIDNANANDWNIEVKIANSLGADSKLKRFKYNHQPTLTELTTDISKAYKIISVDMSLQLGDYSEQKLHSVAVAAIDRLYESLKEEQTTEKRLTRSEPQKPSVQQKVTNFHSYTAPYDNHTFNKKTKYQDNLRALEILYSLGQKTQSINPETQFELAKYVGWGGLKEILLDPNKEEEWNNSSLSYREYVRNIQDYMEKLDPDGSLGLLQSAKRSILNAHYTSYDIINAIYDGVSKAGFKGGKILEPAAGIGNFLATMPEQMAENSAVTAIEMDRISGMILQQLYPTAETHITGFEKLNLPQDNYDLIISNVPFGDVQLFDKQIAGLKDKRYDKAANNIHNFFFAKSILLAKPGSMIALVTSRYTLDAQKEAGIRELMNDTCKFLGAVRLPDTAFQSNAGTQVVSDIIFLKKFDLGESKSQDHDFLNVKSVSLTDRNGQSGMITYNQYFHDNPNNMIGQVEFGGLYRKDEFNLKGDKNIDLRTKINIITDRLFDKPVLKETSLAESNNLHISEELINYIKLGDFDTVGNIVALANGQAGLISSEFYIDKELDAKALAVGVSPDKIRYNKDHITVQEEDALHSAGISIGDFNIKVVDTIRLGKAHLPKIPFLQTLRNQTKELLFKESSGFSDTALEEIRGSLKRNYEQFVFKYGNLTSKENTAVYKNDIDFSLLSALETIEPQSKKITPSDIFYKRTITQKEEIYSTDNLSDAIGLSLQKYGTLQMNYICELMNQSYTELMSTQNKPNALIFVDENGNHLTRDEYLSGNVVAKLEKAQTYADMHSEYKHNVIALEGVQPKPIDAVDIDIMLHARWVPKDVIKDFITELLDTNKFSLSLSKSEDKYSLKIYDSNAKIASLSSMRMKPSAIVSHALNGIEPKVSFTTEVDGKTESKFDPQDTQLAKEIYRRIQDKWDDWKCKDFDRRTRLADIYNSKFNTTILRTFDGEHLTLPGLTNFSPYKHQKDCVFRNVMQMGGINDHMVGAGKTLIQIMTAMELRRLGMAKKPLIIGLKSQIPQLYEQFKKAYPLAKVLYPQPNDFKKENRKRLLNTIATNDWDCVIISHDQFQRLEQPVDIKAALMEELAQNIREDRENTTDSREIKKFEKRLYKLEQQINELLNTPKDNGVLSFDKLGIDFLMVDESQEFKNLEFSTTKKNIKGLGNPKGSKRAFNMLVACRYLQNLHGGDKGVIFSSGTPISNTMAELYLLFKYLRPQKMKELELGTFDRWAAIFAKNYSELEYYMGRFKEVHRFREFVNLPELLTMYREIADVRNNHNLTIDKPKAEHILVKVKPTEAQTNLIDDLQAYINSKGVENAGELGLTAGFDDRRHMNPSFAILAINYAKKLSMDPRLISGGMEAGDKLKTAADNVANIYKETNSFKGTQLIFSDIGTPKSKNVVDNFYEYLSSNDNYSLSESDINEIFGENYYDRPTKPKLEDVKKKAAVILHIDKSDTEGINAILADANSTQSFSVYDEMKRLLVERGIPEHEIAFIHDFNTSKQKDALYSSVNKGEVRIVLGSTKKLGTGVNVQRLAVAGHHLDIAWRPSDIEQRNGRFERQGNLAAKEYLNNVVKSYYYATERTLDASMYNTVSQKAKFIAQLKVVGNVDVRTIKDIEEDIDMGSMAAELSGDPIFKEKADLTKKIGELKMMEKAYNSKRYAMESLLKSTEAGIITMQEKIENLTSALPFVEKIPKNEKGDVIFSASLDGKQFDKVGQYGLALITEATMAKKYKRDNSIVDLGKVWNDFKIVGTVKYDYMAEKMNIKRSIYGPGGILLDSNKDITLNEVAAGTQIKQAILNIPSLIKEAIEKKGKKEKDIIEYRLNIKREFPHKEELNSKVNRMQEIDSIIMSRTENKTKSEEQGTENNVAVNETQGSPKQNAQEGSNNQQQQSSDSTTGRSVAEPEEKYFFRR